MGTIFSNTLSIRDETEGCIFLKRRRGAALMLADTRSTLLRILDPRSNLVAPPSTSSHSPSPPEISWEMVCSAFPIGESLNETTHVFDGSSFTNPEGGIRYFLAALPLDASERIISRGAHLFGKLKRLNRLDTIEHALFRYYTREMDKPFWLILPQEDGLRVLLASDGLPQDVCFISTASEWRKSELERVWQTCGTLPETVLFLSREEGSGIEGWLGEFFKSREVSFSMTPLEITEIAAKGLGY